jgi:hypothetical protein
MDDPAVALSAALASENVLPRENVRDWIARGQDLEALALLYRVAVHGLKVLRNAVPGVSLWSRSSDVTRRTLSSIPNSSLRKD